MSNGVNISLLVHCPGGEHRSESFDYFAHPTSRGSLWQLKGVSETKEKLRLRKAFSHNVTSKSESNNNNNEDVLKNAKEEAQVFMEPIQEFGIKENGSCSPSSFRSEQY